MTQFPEIALRARLVAGGPVRAIIADRMYPLKAPQDAARPYVIYRRISGNPERHMRGAANLASARIQIDSYAATYAAVRGLADAIRLILDGFKGEISTSAAGVFYVRHLSLENETDGFVEPQAGSDDGIYSVSQDFLTFYVLPAQSFT